MLGGLLTLAAIAMLNALATRNINSLRYLIFVVVTGASSLVRTGLPEALFPGAPQGAMDLLKVSTGPLSAALVLHYLGIWLGGPEVDPVTHRITRWGSGFMLAAALVLGLLVPLTPDAHFHQLLNATAVITVIAVLLGLATSMRAALLGDPLAPWVVLAGICLALEVLGLWVRSVELQGFGLGTWILTAVCTVAYFLVGSVVVIKRIRKTRELERLAALPTGTDPATGLPTGSMLLSEVAHAFWRTARLNGECTVVCLRLNNLYGLGETDGRTVEPQILAIMAARIRRAAGFRCIVGLYHSRCFVVVISADKRRQYVGLTVARLRSLAAERVTVTSKDGTQQDFWPRMGVGVVTLDPVRAHPRDVIDQAERQALGPPLRHGRSEDDIATRPSDSLATTGNAAL
jgi:GGDEF domain-containing protein